MSEIDAKTAEAISAAKDSIKLETAAAAARENGSKSPSELKPVEEELPNEPKPLSKAAAHKSFTVDPDLNVGVGILTDVTGPKAAREAFQAVEEGLETYSCTRCKKEFPIDLTGKSYKLCPHCRQLQRERSRRWQQKTKLKPGACRRCGVAIPSEQAHYVLCPSCRLSLRTRKASRFENGKCVHCSGLNDSTEFKVCTRCRNNDKERRKTLEKRGCCNRCAQQLKDEDKTHKVCSNCRSRKKSVAKSTNDQVTITAVAAQAAANPDVSEEYQQQVAQQLEANLFAQEEASQNTNDENIQALAQATTTSAESS